jgi:hypothetical protein
MSCNKQDESLLHQANAEAACSPFIRSQMGSIQANLVSLKKNKALHNGGMN